MSARGQILAWAAVLVVAIVLLVLLRSILLPFVAGIAVAYLLDPLNDRVESWGLSRTWATSLLTATFFAVSTAAALVLTPAIYGQTIGFLEQVPTYVVGFREIALPFLTALSDRLPLLREPDALWSTAASIAQDFAGVAAGAAVRVLGGGIAIFNLVSLLLITPVVAFYLLRDWDDILAHLDALLPRRQRDTVRAQARAVDAVLAGFVRGQAMISLALGILYGLLLSAIGLEFGLVIGLATGILSFVPFVGMAIGMAVAVIVALLQFGVAWAPLAMVIGTFALGQVAESAVLQPRFLGKAVELHPVWVIFGVLAGGALFGFVGVLLAVPATAVAGVLVRFAVARYRDSSAYHEGGGQPPGR
ncbi:MAG: AI-2E family transporter [Proteobacteria bacterium]|nr:AI-2E family transporter [Pseudomonadota bacterium]